MERQNIRLEAMVDPLHPAILRSIKTTIENAHKAGIWVSISGELGANTSLVKMFVEYGIDALTVSPSKILPLRKAICEVD